MGSTEPTKQKFPAPTYGSAGPSLPPSSQPMSSYAPSQPYGYYSAPPVAPRTNGLAIGALICIFVIPFIAPVLGIIALKQINESNGREKGQGMAVAGIVVGGLMILGLLVAALGG
jgi:hypothetical protein